MTAPMLDAAFRAAKVIGGDETLKVVQMPMLDARGAWCTVLDLPPGIPAKKAMRAVDELAAAFGVESAQVSVSKVGRAGRIELYVSKSLPFTDKPGRGPLLELEGATDFWGRIAIGPDVRGERVSISVVERSGLVGGEPGAGKSASGNTILLAAALDPRVILWLADGKGGGDLEPFEPLCDEFEGDADPEAFYKMLEAAIADMKSRYALLKKLGKRKVDESLANRHPELRQKLVWVDELMFYTTDEDFGKKITKALRNLVSRGRAAGIVTFCATQKPGSDVVDTSLRDLLSIRWALRCTTPEASDTILGKGAAASGYSAKTIESEMRGSRPSVGRGHQPPHGAGRLLQRRAGQRAPGARARSPGEGRDSADRAALPRRPAARPARGRRQHLRRRRRRVRDPLGHGRGGTGLAAGRGAPGRAHGVGPERHRREARCADRAERRGEEGQAGLGGQPGLRLPAGPGDGHDHRPLRPHGLIQPGQGPDTRPSLGGFTPCRGGLHPGPPGRVLDEPRPGPAPQRPRCPSL